MNEEGYDPQIIFVCQKCGMMDKRKYVNEIIVHNSDDEEQKFQFCSRCQDEQIAAFNASLKTNNHFV